MDIEDWRSEIDEIDMQLLRLLNQRARIAIEVGALKRAAELPLCDPQREAKILNRVHIANSGPLDDAIVTRLFRHIISTSRSAESVADGEAGSIASGEISL